MRVAFVALAVPAAGAAIYVEDSCWRRLRRRPEVCCVPEGRGDPECWEGQAEKVGLQFTYARCCTDIFHESIYERELDESAELDALPYLFDNSGTPVDLLFGEPQHQPTVEEPFVFLHDRRVGGTDMKRKIWLTAWASGLLNVSVVPGFLDVLPRIRFGCWNEKCSE